jgi:hypothetical protein
MNEKETLDYCYKMGKDAAINGANSKNCNFALFGTPEYKNAWEKGNKDGKSDISSGGQDDCNNK